jgi:hypothetical protein
MQENQTRIVHFVQNEEINNKSSSKAAALLFVIFLIGTILVLIYYCMKNSVKIEKALFGQKPIRRISLKDSGMYNLMTDSIRKPVENIKTNCFPIYEPKIKKDYKLGIYSKKEGIREFPIIKQLDDMDVMIPNLTKKLKKSKEDKAPTFMELEFLRDGEFIGNYKSMAILPIDATDFESGKIIGFTESKISLNITLSEPKFVIIIPVSSDLKVSVLNEDSDTEEEIYFDRPILIRTEKSIIISQYDNTPKQFLMLKLKL